MVWTVDSKTEFLATWTVLCIEGPALVTANIAVELGMANGTQVIIKAAMPHEDDEQGWQNIRKPIVKLSRPPICVFVEAINGDKNMTEYYPGRPPTGRLDLQNIYVMLSTMAKWEDLAILRPYQENIFDVPPDPHYLNYDRYLKEQDKETKVCFLRTKSFVYANNVIDR